MILSSMRDVVFGYGKEPVIDQLSLDIHVGEFVGITGPNGSAKTTMLKLLLGLLEPWSGSVHMSTQQLRGKSWRSVTYLSKSPSFNSGFPSTVIELVRSGCYHKLGLFGDSPRIKKQLWNEACVRSACGNTATHA